MFNKLHANALIFFSILTFLPSISLAADSLELIPPAGEPLPPGVTNERYPHFQFKATGGSESYIWAEGDKKLPAGLSLDAETGRILGSPTGKETDSPVDITVKDKNKSNLEQKGRYFISIYSTQAEKVKVTEEICFTPSGSQGEPGDLGRHFSVGPTITTQLIRYNFNNKQASFNAKGLGVGAALRYYRDSDIVGAPDGGAHDIRRIKPACRATTFTTLQNNTDQIKAKAFFSITPTIFAFYDDAQGGSSGQGQLNVQPALLLGFFRDIINVGVGWNMAGQQRGQAFLLMGIGTGFSF